MLRGKLALGSLGSSFLVGLIAACGSASAEDESAFFGPPPSDATTDVVDDWAPDTGADLDGRGKLGIRGGFYIPTSNYEAGPEAAVFWQKDAGKVKIELSLGFARVASDGGSTSSSLWIGRAGAILPFHETDRIEPYVMAGLGGTSERAESAWGGDSSFLPSFDLAVGLVSKRVVDVRAGLSFFTNSDNVSSAGFLSVGVIY